MSQDFLEVRLGKVSLQVPVVDNPETTRRIASEITERLAAIEKASPRIDTQGFALRVAYEYAAQAHALEGDVAEATREFLRALGEMNDRLTGILDAYEEQRHKPIASPPDAD